MCSPREIALSARAPRAAETSRKAPPTRPTIVIKRKRGEKKEIAFSLGVSAKSCTCNEPAQHGVFASNLRATRAWLDLHVSSEF